MKSIVIALALIFAVGVAASFVAPQVAMACPEGVDGC